jgi:hypothetical protein
MTERQLLFDTFASPPLPGGKSLFGAAASRSPSGFRFHWLAYSRLALPRFSLMVLTLRSPTFLF